MTEVYLIWEMPWGFKSRRLLYPMGNREDAVARVTELVEGGKHRAPTGTHLIGNGTIVYYGERADGVRYQATRHPVVK